MVSINKNWVSEKENPSTETAINGVCVISKDGFKGAITNNLVGGNRWMTGQDSTYNPILSIRTFVCIISEHAFAF
ncbi:hypothetical protein GAG94_22615 [Lysinibacillus sphaericus]|uniref:hypothetical protein n=1 Tax=Lysinibacillus sp. VIII_CA TaxID=3417452 RepID=UPI0013B0968A|nr:hypothetical protein GAG94_22615 [Lysinibacillus sphaericus]